MRQRHWRGPRWTAPRRRSGGFGGARVGETIDTTLEPQSKILAVASGPSTGPLAGSRASRPARGAPPEDCAASSGDAQDAREGLARPTPSRHCRSAPSRSQRSGPGTRRRRSPQQVPERHLQRRRPAIHTLAGLRETSCSCRVQFAASRSAFHPLGVRRSTWLMGTEATCRREPASRESPSPSGWSGLPRGCRRRGTARCREFGPCGPHDPSATASSNTRMQRWELHSAPVAGRRP